MFVRIVYITKTNQSESLYECKHVHFRQSDNKELVTIHMEGPEVIRDIVKHSHEVYVMNNQGKTIDAYRWS